MVQKNIKRRGGRGADGGEENPIHKEEDKEQWWSREVGGREGGREGRTKEDVALCLSLESEHKTLL